MPLETVGKHWPKPVDDSHWYGSLLVELLEYGMKEGADTVRRDAVGWYGGHYNRLRVKTEGECWH